MDDFGARQGSGTGRGGDHGGDDWPELLARTVAHLAAQLTVTQVRLRALATVLDEQGAVDPGLVAEQVGRIARSDAGTFLRENLGETLVEVIDTELLEQDLVAYLSDESGSRGVGKSGS